MDLQARAGYATVRRIVRSMVFAAGGALALSMPLGAQEGPPIGGLTGTVALEGTVEQEYAGATTVIVKTVDGVRHVFHFGKDLIVHGGKGTGVDALQGLRAGATVAVHYTVTGGEASAQDRAAVDAARDLDGAPKRAVRVTVYYTDDAGHKVAHFFKKAS